MTIASIDLRRGGYAEDVALLPEHDRPSYDRGRRGSLLGGVLVGVGLMAGLDEIVFHQLLGWHHLYDGAGRQAGLTADGLLHLFELSLYLVGFAILVALATRRAVHWPVVGAAVCLGAGGFQLFDGLITHKVLRLHQVRYGVELWPYDLAWNAGAVLLLILGAVLLRRAGRAELSGRTGPDQRV